MKVKKHSFWKWAYSDFLSNTTRSVLWEFIVHEALWLSDDKRVDWDNVDLRWNNLKIEVKTSAYIQSWEQKNISKISFDIASRKRAWDSVKNSFSEVPWREADIYIFCVFEILEKADANEDVIMDTNNWWFYILKSSYLNQFFPNQKSISLSVLQKHAKRLSFYQIRDNI